MLKKDAEKWISYDHHHGVTANIKEQISPVSNGLCSVLEGMWACLNEKGQIMCHRFVCSTDAKSLEFLK